MRVEVAKEADGRWIAEVLDLPGVMAYGKTRQAATAKVKTLARRVAEDKLKDKRNTRRVLTVWAADCAEHVLGLFEARQPRDGRPRKAVAAARAWARGEIKCGAARTAALSAHAAARAATDPAAIAAARACGHAAATAHVATHSRAAADYARKAVTLAAAAAATAKELAWQKRRLPKHLRPKNQRSAGVME